MGWGDVGRGRHTKTASESKAGGQEISAASLSTERPDAIYPGRVCVTASYELYSSNIYLRARKMLKKQTREREGKRGAGARSYNYKRAMHKLTRLE